ncbi:type II toxin-antitoxin system RelE/ParE family toxin [Burkholderia cepacia]|uniref:type II toxin-antitoxin system RelE/ParE family toxin n=1 Tax=Burkholderia cepacia TaxID=292 RepID=UPI002ABD4465|nr:type II toxin-antitoxin system YafQ family toxin [Burkholderia cepacia]
MRKIEQTEQFRADYRRAAVARYRPALGALLSSVLSWLGSDAPLPVKYRDRAMIGEWSDHQSCHLQRDWILIYRKPDEHTLQLVRLGSQDELGL